MPNPNIQTAYSGEVLDKILVKVSTGNQLFQQGLIHLEAGINDKLTIPRMQLTKMLQKRKEMPTSSNSKGEFKITERQLVPHDAMVYTEFNPNAFRHFWKKWQPSGELVFGELPTEVQETFIEALISEVGTELEYHFIQGSFGDGEEQYFDGLLTRIKADPAVVKAKSESVSILDRLKAVWAATSSKVRSNPNFTFLMSSNDFDTYDNELTALHHKGADPTGVNKAAFKGHRIVALDQWPSDVIVGTICSTEAAKTNLFAGTSLAEDFNCVQVDKVTNAGELYFFKMLFKADTQIAWGELVTLLDKTSPEAA